MAAVRSLNKTLSSLISKLETCDVAWSLNAYFRYLLAWRASGLFRRRPPNRLECLPCCLWRSGGGIRGILFGTVDHRFPAHGGYWVTAFLFGAVLPSAVALL